MFPLAAEQCQVFLQWNFIYEVFFPSTKQEWMSWSQAPCSQLEACFPAILHGHVPLPSVSFMAAFLDVISSAMWRKETEGEDKP